MENYGKEKGQLEEKREVAVSMLAEQMPLETIARVTKLSIVQIQEIQAHQ